MATHTHACAWASEYRYAFADQFLQDGILHKRGKASPLRPGSTVATRPRQERQVLNAPKQRQVPSRPKAQAGSSQKSRRSDFSAAHELGGWAGSGMGVLRAASARLSRWELGVKRVALISRSWRFGVEFFLVHLFCLSILFFVCVFLSIRLCSFIHLSEEMYLMNKLIIVWWMILFDILRPYVMKANEKGIDYK